MVVVKISMPDVGGTKSNCTVTANLLPMIGGILKSYSRLVGERCMKPLIMKHIGL
jgi:hypothetical protein